MIDAVQDCLSPKRFSIVAYVCLLVHFLVGLAFTVLATVLRPSENDKFSCLVDAESTATYKKQVDQACFARYDLTYNTPLPLYGFALLTTGSGILVSLIYSQIVSARVDEIESRYERTRCTNGETENYGQNRKTVYVSYFYFFHLISRGLLSIIFTFLQNTYFYPNGFDSEFVCDLPSISNIVNTPKAKDGWNISLNGTFVTCENPVATDKRIWATFIIWLNSCIAIVMVVEVVYICRFLPIFNHRVGWNDDNQFVIIYFLRKQYNVPLEHEQLNTIKNNPHSSKRTPIQESNFAQLKEREIGKRTTTREQPCFV